MVKLLHRLNKVKWNAHRPFISGSEKITNNLNNALNAHKSGDYEGAISIIHSVPNWQTNPIANRILGHALLGLELFNESIDAHYVARDLKPKNDFKRMEDEINIASAFVAQKKYEEALEALERILQQDKNYIPALLGKIAIFNRQDDDAKLMELLAKITMELPLFWDNNTVKRFLETDTDMLKIKNIVNQITQKENNT